MFVSTSGCRTTGAGPLGEPIDLKPYLPASVRSQPEPETTAHHAEIDVDGARVDVEWRTFAKGPKAYVRSVKATVEKASDGLHLSRMSFVSASYPTEPDGPVEGLTEEVQLSIDFERNTLTTGHEGGKNVTVRGDGSWH